MTGWPRRWNALHLPVDVLELGVAVGMAAAFPRLAVGLEAVTELVQQGADRPGTDRVTLAASSSANLAALLQVQRKATRGRLGSPARPTPPGRPAARIVLSQRLATPAGAADTSGHAGWIGRAAGLTQLPQSGPDGHVSHAGGLGDPGDPSTADGRRLGRRPEATGALIEDGLEGLVLDLEALDGGGVHESEHVPQRLSDSIELFLRAA